MTNYAGSGVVITFANAGGSAQTVLGGRTKKVEFSAEVVDVTNSNSSSMFRQLLSGAGVISGQISVEGVFDNDAGVEAVRSASFDRTTRAMTFVLTGFGTVSGTFKLTDISIDATYNDAIMYSFTATSAGTLTFSAS